VAFDSTNQLVVEVFTPDGESAGNLFFIGSNTAAESAPSYLSAAVCGVPTPTTTAGIGFPNMHVVMTVNGSCTGGGGCTLTCPANITTGANTMQSGMFGATVTYPAPTVSGTCGTVTCTPASGSFFPVGTTTVTCTATAGPTCSFTVAVTSAFTNCYVDDVTGDTLSINTDPTSALYRTWQYHVVATGQILAGSAEGLSYYPGHSLVAYDLDSATVKMDLNVNIGARTATTTVQDLTTHVTHTLRDRNITNDPPCT
jgi:hypothetical protein